MMHRMWKYVGMIQCPDGMVAVQYGIRHLHDDVGDADEGELMMATVEVLRETGCGTHRVRALGRVYTVHTHHVREHPMQARQWMSLH